MRHGVDGLWGPVATQRAPNTTLERGPVEDQPELVSSEITVDLDLDHRKKGLVWFPTYVVDFEGTYGFENRHPYPVRADVRFALDRSGDSFDGFRVIDEQGQAVAYEIRDGEATWKSDFNAGQTKRFAVGYRSRGIESWHYDFGIVGEQREIRDFKLAIAVDDEAVDFGEHTLSPTHHQTSGGSWTGEWEFDSLITHNNIGVVLANKINPGPLASRITFFAPVGLLFFFFLVAMFSVVRGPRLHPMHFFFFGCSFFAFHLLFAYLVDHVPVQAAFGVATLTSVFLAVGYARAIQGSGFAFRVIGAAQLVYLVLFSASFFIEGFTGLTVAIGAVITLAVAMRLSAGHEWTGQTPSPERAAAAASGVVPVANSGLAADPKAASQGNVSVF